MAKGKRSGRPVGAKAPIESDTENAGAFDLQKFLPYSITVLAAQMSDRFGELYRQRFDISVAEWRILAHVAVTDELSVREIAEGVVLDKAKVSRAVARLEAAGHIRKRAGKTDGRLIRVTMTPKGRRMFERIAPLADEFQSWLLEVLDPMERDHLQASIAELRARLNQPTEF
jgi:DNA-binding MarR family transcriptional regulator